MGDLQNSSDQGRERNSVYRITAVFAVPSIGTVAGVCLVVFWSEGSDVSPCPELVLCNASAIMDSQTFNRMQKTCMFLVVRPALASPCGPS